jgi:hypothetical protein
MRCPRRLQAAIYEVLRVELYVSYAGGDAQDDHLQDLAAKVTAAALMVGWLSQLHPLFSV